MYYCQICLFSAIHYVVTLTNRPKWSHVRQLRSHDSLGCRTPSCSEQCWCLVSHTLSRRSSCLRCCLLSLARLIQFACYVQAAGRSIAFNGYAVAVKYNSAKNPKLVYLNNVPASVSRTVMLDALSRKAGGPVIQVVSVLFSLHVRSSPYAIVRT